jgi:two-component system KDP operon response regulator KdpE
MTKVLVIDDEPQIRRFLRAGYELHGFWVLEAENAAAGLRVATMNSPDLIVLDLNLPDLDGAEVLERLRSWSNIPVIVLSIHADEQEKVRLLKSGADDYVVKPFGISELLARSEAMLRRQMRSADREPVVKVGPLSVDLMSKMATLDGRILVRKLRQKIEIVPTDPQLIISESGIGYRLERGASAKREDHHRCSSGATCPT